MRNLVANLRWVLPTVCLLWLCSAPALLAGAEQAGSVGRPGSYLQVTGSSERISVSASHADLLNVFNLVFAQAHQQFVPDGDISGDVTLTLSGQPLIHVLDEICHNAYLRYEVDKDGIYRIHRDDLALKATFVRMRALNSSFREQLLRMGFTLPGVSPQGAVVRPELQNPAVRSNAAGGAQTGGAAPITPNSSGADSSTAQQGATAHSGAQVFTPYDQIMRDRNLVGVHATSAQPMPIVEVLQQFSRQSGVPILIDPGIPTGLRFRFYGNIVRPLPEALNLLTDAAQLEWHETGGQIFVTTIPSLQIYLDDHKMSSASSSPSSSKTVSPTGQQRSTGQGGAAQPHKPATPQKLQKASSDSPQKVN